MLCPGSLGTAPGSVLAALFPARALAAPAEKSNEAFYGALFLLGTVGLVITQPVMIPVCLKELAEDALGIQRKVRFCFSSPSFPLFLNHHFV